MANRIKSYMYEIPEGYEARIEGNKVIIELAESEDEKIRKALVKYFEERDNYRDEDETFNGISFSAILAYLEKQKDAFENGRQLGIMQEQARQELEWPDEKQKERRPVKRPKFKIGDVVKFKGFGDEPADDTPLKIVGYDNELYLFDNGTTDLFSEQNLYELVEQKPIQPYIKREYIEKRLKGLIDKDGEYCRGSREELAHLYYILGGEPSQYLINNVAKEEQKPVEIDEDVELGLDRALQIVEKAKGNLQGYQTDDGIYECDHAIGTLKHILKRGVKQKPVEWSEEDEKTINDACTFIDKYADSINKLHLTKSLELYRLSEKLKSLRSQKLDASKLENFDPIDVLNRIKTEWPMAWEKVVGEQEWSEEEKAAKK